jgi:hypothetical protein
LFRRALLSVLAAALLLVPFVVPSGADAAKRRVPFGFFGAVVPPLMASPLETSDTALTQQTGLMAQSGVETVRLTLQWRTIEPEQGVYSYRELDRLVAAAAIRRLSATVNITDSPRWAVPDPNDPDYFRTPPKDPNTYAAMMRQLVLRYGPTGSFWAQNPSLPRVPVRQWQVWNEQTGPAHWKPRPWARSYKALLKPAYQAIHSVDRRAKVVAGSLVTTGSYTQWAGARDLYKSGAKRYFDVVSIHPFTNNSVSVSDSARRFVEIIRRVRAIMRKRGDARKPIIVTEMTWPASLGRIPKAGQLHFSVTRKGQVQRLKAAYRALARARRKLRVTQAYWYTWATQYNQGGSIATMAFRFSGLTRFTDGAFSPLPILRTYRKVAAKYEGCRKTADARRCR